MARCESKLEAELGEEIGEPDLYPTGPDHREVFLPEVEPAAPMDCDEEYLIEYIWLT